MQTFFVNQQGERIADVKTAFVNAYRKAGIADFTMHDLRHTCVAWPVSAGASLIEVRDLLGHSTIKMTEGYAHLAPNGCLTGEPKYKKKPKPLRCCNHSRLR